MDEAPQAYKDVSKIMETQADLVHALAKFSLKIVGMADGKAKVED